MNMALIMTAVKYGATIANYTELRELNKNASGKVTGAEVVDLMSGEKITVKAKVRRNQFPVPLHNIDHIPYLVGRYQCDRSLLR